MGEPGAMTDLYEVLEVPRNASAKEIEQAYARIMAYLGPGAMAIYSMFDESEVAEQRSWVEEAYRVLSTPERRAAYDKTLMAQNSDSGQSDYPALILEDSPAEPSSTLRFGGGERSGFAASAPSSVSHLTLDATDTAADIPAVDTAVDAEADPMSAQPDAASETAQELAPTPQEPIQPALGVSMVPTPVPTYVPKSPGPLDGPMGAEASGKRLSLITPQGPPPEPEQGTEYSGEVLRSYRERAGASLAEVASISKISKRYLRAIEADDCANLPAPVYVRGFVAEYARVLGLDPQKVASSYLELLKRCREGLLK